MQMARIIRHKRLKFFIVVWMIVLGFSSGVATLRASETINAIRRKSPVIAMRLSISLLDSLIVHFWRDLVCRRVRFYFRRLLCKRRVFSRGRFLQIGGGIPGGQLRIQV
jgi:hypothetical protein